VPTAPASPGRVCSRDIEDLPGLPGDWDRWLADDALHDALPGDPGEAWLISDPLAEDPLAEDPLADDPLAEKRLAELLAADPGLAGDAWLAEDPDWANPEPTVREVLKAGRWDRSRGDGAGFAAGGVTDRLPPGPTLAGLAGDAWNDGLDQLSDDELIGVLRAARRLTSWATAMELAAVADLWRRRTAEEDAGDDGAARYAAEEIAAALTLTVRAADKVLGLAVALCRLPATRRALAAGDIDAPRAIVIADEVTGLADAHAATVDQAVAGDAPDQTTGQLRAATRRAAIAADPDAARQRKEEALREARVERWDEHAGTAALAGRDLPPAAVLAADYHLTALAEQLKAAGAPGTMDTLRAQVYLALLSGVPVSSLVPGEPEHVYTGAGKAGAPGSRGRVNLTLPMATWLGLAEVPGHAAGYGPLDATDSRALATALAARADSKWCLTLTDRDGRPVAHGCARPRRNEGRRRAPPAAKPPGEREAAQHPGTARAGPGGMKPTWTFTITLLDTGPCDHARETPAYEPPPGLRHLVEARQFTCTFPGCRRPASQCDLDHTVPYHQGGRTCLCNLSPLCRRHHEVKQATGWALEQASPGVMTWTTPAGRRYTVLCSAALSACGA
jgi:hypothetical protein